MELPPELLALFPPASDLMLDRVRRLVDDEMLWDIANADYGVSANEVFPLLCSIRENGSIPFPMPFQLGEVLELTRWCDPDPPNPPPFQPGPTGFRGHQTRLFACAVLLRSADNDSYEDTAEDSTLAQLLASARLAGDQINNALGRYLIWRAGSGAVRSHRIMQALSLLVVTARITSNSVEAALEAASDWVIAEDARRSGLGWSPVEPVPLDFSIQQGFWKPLWEELHAKAEAVSSDELREKLKLCTLLVETPL